jgi:hypothetical protein
LEKKRESIFSKRLYYEIEPNDPLYFFPAQPDTG